VAPRGPWLIVLPDAERVSRLAAELVANRLRGGRRRLMLPTGHTPLGTYAALRGLAAAGALPTRDAVLFQLDEYYGLDALDPRSYRAYLRRELDMPFAERHELDGSDPDPDAQCAAYETRLAAAPIDLAVLGLGPDGHVAFNEPGSTLSMGVRRVALHPTTRAAAAADFGGIEHVPTHALTVGLRTLVAAHELLVLAVGAGKAAPLRAVLSDRRSPALPASLLRAHPRLTVICDREAAAELPHSHHWDADRAAIVLGHREPGISREHRISHESLDRLRRALLLARQVPLRAVILTGYSATGGLSEAEQMAAAVSFGHVPVLLDVAGRDTAENAACSLPYVLALGVRRVTVVSSAWHLRAPFFFAPYRRRGLEVDHRWAWSRGSWPRMLGHEIALAPRAPALRRRAMAGVHPVE
jgi:glucosamine-6-phosphate deaminase